MSNKRDKLISLGANDVQFFLFFFAEYIDFVQPTAAGCLTVF